MHLGPKTKVNDETKSDSFPIPRIADCIDQIGNAKFVSTFDMQKGYWQVSSQNFRVCNTRWFISVQGHAVLNGKCTCNIQKNV